MKKQSIKSIKTKFGFLIVVALLWTGCKKETPQKQPSTSETEKTAVTSKQCYSYEQNGNSISLQLEITGDKASGAMAYSIAEKDKNTGILEGTIKDSILIADYTFQSEGTQSKRQVAFQFKDDKLIEGYGEMNDEGTNFKDTRTLKFDSSMPLIKTDCSK